MNKHLYYILCALVALFILLVGKFNELKIARDLIDFQEMHVPSEKSQSNDLMSTKRQRMQDSIMSYNQAIQSFPNSFFASLFGFQVYTDK